MSNQIPSTLPIPNRLSEDIQSRRWWLIFIVIYGLWIGLPWMAPLLMHWGWNTAADTIYFIYSFFCHQLPERSFFLFGQKTMYSLAEVQAAWQNTLDPMVLRQFVGNAQMGWKVAWSDRMVSFYSTIWLFALAWWPFRRKVKALPLWGLALFLLPITLDGVTHMISDMAGIEQGFRESNWWLAVLTHQALPVSFYAGNALGSFNSWMRLVTGPIASLGLDWFVFPAIYHMYSLDRELDKIDYGKTLRKVQDGHPGPSG